MFSFGAWARAQSVPVGDDKGGGISLTADFKLRITLIDGNRTQIAEAAYNPYVSDWQFASGSISATFDFTKVRITFIYANNMNTADVTGLYCLAEEYGETYTYDVNGNLVSSADVAKVENAYGYAENNLTSAQSDSRDRSFAGYEEDTKNLRYMVNTENQLVEYTYDDYGNIVFAEVSPAGYTTTPQSGKTYRIVNAATGMALGAKESQASTDAVNSRISNDAKTQWILQAGNSAGEFNIKRKNANAYLAVDGSGDGTYPIKSKTGVANTAAALFTFSVQDDGSIKILTKTSNSYYAVDAHWNVSDTADVDYPVYQYLATDAHASQKWYFFEVQGATETMYGEASYDDSGSLLAQQTSASGGTTTYNYNGNAYQLTSKITDSNGGSTYYQYYTMGQTKKVICGSTNVVYAYSNDWLDSITVSNTITYDFSKDAFSRPTMTKMNDLLLAQTTYDAYGRVSSHKDAANKTDSYTYDALDRISQITYNGNTLKYYYGSNGKLAQATDSIADTRTKYVYDLAGRVVSERTYSGTALDVSNLQSALDYTYTNGTNQLSAIKTKSTLGTNTLGITYGDLTDAKSSGYIYSESWNGAVAKRYTYDDFGRIASNRTQTTATSLNTVYTYKNLTSWRTTPLVESLQTPAATYTYTYDNNGNILSESDGVYTTSYEYYANNMLKRENNQRAGYTRTYTYVDANISTVKTYAYTTGALGTALSTNVYAYDPNCMDLLTSARGKNIYYTGVMPNTYDGHAVTWARSGLMSTYDSGTDSHSYTYDVSGRRLEKEDNGVTTEFIYAGDLLLGQKTGTNSLTFKFDSNGDYFGFTYNGTPYYYVKNLQGDVVAIANNAGTIVVRYYYDAWGKLLSYTDTSGANIATINPIRYRSYYYDTETGFYYLQSRYYDPEIGRFISPDDPDTLGVSPNDVTDKNLFAYCDNNPVTREDSGGEFWHLVVGGIIGGAIGCVSSIISQMHSDTGEVDIVKCLISTGAGIASGVLTASGVGLLGQVVGGALIGGVSNVLDQGRDLQTDPTKKFNVKSLALDTVVGGALGLLSWTGASSVASGAGGQKQMINLGKNTVKRTFNALFHKGIGAYTSTAAKAAKYYIKSTAKVTSNLFSWNVVSSAALGFVYNSFS